MNATMRNELHFLATGNRARTERKLRSMDGAEIRNHFLTRATEAKVAKVVAEMRRLHDNGMTYREIDNEMFGISPTSRSQEVSYYLTKAR